MTHRPGTGSLLAPPGPSHLWSVPEAAARLYLIPPGLGRSLLHLCLAFMSDEGRSKDTGPLVLPGGSWAGLGGKGRFLDETGPLAWDPLSPPKLLHVRIPNSACPGLTPHRGGNGSLLVTGGRCAEQHDALSKPGCEPVCSLVRKPGEGGRRRAFLKLPPAPGLRRMGKK